MATKNTALRNLLADAFGDNFNSGTLEILAGATVLVSFTLPADAFAAAASGQVTLNNTPITEQASNGGTADGARIRSNGGTYEVSGLSVGTSGAQVNINDLNIVSGQDVDLNSFSWTVPAGTA